MFTEVELRVMSEVLRHVNEHIIRDIRSLNTELIEFVEFVDGFGNILPVGTSTINQHQLISRIGQLFDSFCGDLHIGEYLPIGILLNGPPQLTNLLNQPH